MKKLYRIIRLLTHFKRKICTLNRTSLAQKSESTHPCRRAYAGGGGVIRGVTQESRKGWAYLGAYSRARGGGRGYRWRNAVLCKNIHQPLVDTKAVYTDKKYPV